MYQTSNNYKSKIYEASTKHLLRIFINSTEIDSKYILDCKPSHILFGDGTFSLGSVSCKGIDLKLYKTAVPNTINSVYITSGITGEEIPVGYFNVDSISKDDDYTVTLKLLDNMIKFEVNYDASQLTYPCTLIQILQDICTTCGVELGTNTFLGSSREVSVFDNSISARTYVSYIAEQAGGFAFIGRDGKLYIKTIGESTGTLDIKYFKNFKWGDKFKISKVVYNGLATYEAGTDTNNTIYINPENMYINSQAEITNIYNQIKDLEVYSFSGDSIIDPALDIGDLLSIDGRNVIYQGTMDYGGKWKAGITSDIQSKEQEDTTSRTFSQTLINRVTEEAINNITNTESTKEGNPIMIDDSTEEPIIRLEVDGHSEQATRSGKNLYNVNGLSTTGNTSIDDDGWITINIDNSQGSRTLINDFKHEFSNLINVSTRYALFLEIKNISGEGYLVVNETRTQSQCVTNLIFNLSSLTSNSINKYIFITKNNFQETTNMLWSYVYTTAGKSCSVTFRISVLADTTTTTDNFIYEPYGASPSPDYPSEIHSVADDVNLLNLENIENHSINSFYYENIGTNFQLKAGETYTLSFDAESDITPFNVGIGCGSGGNYQSDILNENGFQNGRISITFTPQNSNFTYGNYLALRFVRYNSSTSYTYSARNIKLQKGTVATPYSPYNQGTVTIKQRGKNLFNIENYSKSGYNVTIANPLKGLSTGDYTISCQNTADVGLSIIFSNEINGSMIGGYFTGFDFGRTLTNRTTSLTQEQLDANYLIMRGNNNSITEELLENMQIQIEEGTQATDYEPYQTPHDYTIQTSPLRSLPNGVKDTIEADGIHRRVGRIVLEDIIELTEATIFGTQGKFASYGLLNAKNEGRTYTFMSDKIMYANEDFLQYGAFRNSTILLVMTTADDTLENYNSKISGSEVLYELATEVIEPFTDKQQNVIDSIETNLYTQYFSSPTNMRITYLRENGLTDTYETKQNASKKYAEIKIETDKIDLKVAKDDVIGSINLSSEEASINASKINLNGVVTANQNFKILNDGSMEAKNGKFTGGTIDLSSSADGTSANSVFKIYDTNNPNDVYTYIYPRRINLEENGNYLSLSTEEGMSLIDLSENYTYEDEGGNEVTITFQSIDSVQVDDDNTLAMRKGQFVYRADAPGYPMHYIEMQGKEDGCKLVIGDTINAEETTIEASKMTYGTEGLYAPHRYGVRFDKYGNLVLKENNENNSCAWGIFDENGNRRFKVVFNNGHVENSDEDGNGVFAAGGGTIYFRPNGTENTSSQAFIDSSGNFYLSSESFIKGYCGSTAINLIRAYNNMTALGDSNYETGIWGSAFRIYPSSYFSAYCQFNDSVDINANLYVNNHSIRAKDIYDNNTVTNATNMYITSNGWIRRTTNTSSKEYKENIKDIQKNELNPERLYDLEIKQFKYKDQYQPNEKDSRYNKELIGFIAEDLEKIYPIAVDYSEDGKIDNWNERYIIPAMLKLIQNQKKEIDNLKERLDRLEKGN